MASMARPIELVDQLRPVEQGERERWRRRAGAAEAHEVAMHALDALRQIEIGGTSPAAAGDSLRVVAWNLERGSHLDGAVAVLRAAGAQIVLGTELDVGMARSGNRHVAAEVAAQLGHRYAFGVEFVELGLGDDSEQERLGADAVNDAGFHGNAILADRPLSDVLLVRIEQDGTWFRGGTDQPRVGGRLAVAARVELAGAPVVVCAVHLESESDPALRRDQLGVVLAALDERYGRLPAVIGGDLNTFSTSQAEARRDFRALREADPGRFCWPVPHEPLFEAARRHGFDEVQANEPEQTMRIAATQRPGSLLRLDWLLVRDLEVVERATIPAVGADGTVLSDHDAVAATLRHRG